MGFASLHPEANQKKHPTICLQAPPWLFLVYMVQLFNKLQHFPLYSEIHFTTKNTPITLKY